MSLAQVFLPEFDFEMPVMRKVLERIPEDRLGWTPHPKSFTMLGLASHLATIPSYVEWTFKTESLDIAPVGGEPMKPPQLATRAEVLETFDRGVIEARAVLEGATDEQMLKSWSLLAGGTPLFTMPRIAVLRGMVLKHMVHHRAQLTVYLRMCDVPVPAIYGPSADES